MLGERIRSRRQELGLSLRDLASKVDLTASFLSQVERGVTSPSLNSLRRLAETLGVPIFYFLDEMSAISPVVRHDARKVITMAHHGVRYQLLTPDLNHKMEVFVVEQEPDGCNIALPLGQPTEECIFVLQGQLRIRLEENVYTLGAGDSIYFEGARLRELMAIGDTPVTFLSAITPPIF